MSALRSLFNHIKRLPCRTAIPPNDLSLTQEIEYKFDFSALHRYKNIAGDVSDLSALKCLILPQAPPGLFVFPAVLNKEACKKWYTYFKEKAPVDSYQVLRSNVTLPPEDREHLRWLTFGFHYNWDMKCYREEEQNSIPDAIVDLVQCIAHLLNLKKWKVETGIVNYYTCKSRLGPHVDGYEKNKGAPLLSLSLGSDGIFVMDGDSEGTKKPSSLLLRDGDVMILSGESRLMTHALAKVYCTSNSPSCSRRKIVRINVNARQFNDEKDCHRMAG